MQAVGLIAAEIERHGIPTVSITLLEEITKIIKPPRALFVPFKMGYPLGEANNAELQHRVINSALELFSRNDTPILEYYS